MGNPSRIGIATRGYRTGSSNPGKICIATYGYRCPEEAPAPPFDRRDGDGGTGIRHGNVIVEPYYAPKDVQGISDEQLALLAVLAINEYYES